MSPKTSTALVLTSALAGGAAHGAVVYTNFNNLAIFCSYGNSNATVSLTPNFNSQYFLLFEDGNSQKPEVRGDGTNTFVLARTWENTSSMISTNRTYGGLPVTPGGVTVNANMIDVNSGKQQNGITSLVVQTNGYFVDRPIDTDADAGGTDHYNNLGDWGQGTTSSGYVGLVMVNSGITNFGWAHFTWSDPDTNYQNSAETLTLIDGAYESNPNTGILTGAGGPQTVSYVVDQFSPTGTGIEGLEYPAGGGFTNIWLSYYAAGQITNIWENWFGGAFQSLVWDPSNDANNNTNSGSMKITANFSGANNQWAVYDFNGTYPPVNGMQYTNFSFDIRFAQGSCTTTNGTTPLFGHLILGDAVGWSQDWFAGVDIPASTTNWQHVSVPINPASDTNLANIYNVIIHIYGPYYTPMSGTSTCWVDNVEFEGPSPVATNCIVNWNDVHQRIDGFGASSGFYSNWTTNQADMFFSTNIGIGLSLERSVVVAGTTVEGQMMQWAQARGARVWSTPYTPDAQYKSSDSLNGGSFLPANYQPYASELAGYVTTNGVNLYAISIQNEPDVSANYQSCLWTSQQFHDFVPYLKSALVASNVASTKIMLAEDENWQTNYYETAMIDPAVATNVGIIACHDYDGSPPSVIPVALPKYANTNAALWLTEVSTFDQFNGYIPNAIYWATRIHLFMTVGQVNAWNWWWLQANDGKDDNEGLTDINGIPARRMYALGNYSRFVRPGFYRIGVTNNGFTSISAYKNPNSGSFAIVAINSSFTTVMQTFNLSNFTASSVIPWITSSTLATLTNQPAIGVTNSAFTYAMPPSSVVTFVGVGQAVVPPVAISIQQAGGSVILNWSQGTLLQATNLMGPWTTNNATPPYTNQPGYSQLFYRVRVQ